MENTGSKPGQVNTLLQYRFVKKSADKLGHDDRSGMSGNGESHCTPGHSAGNSNNYTGSHSQNSTQEYHYSPLSITTIPESLLPESSQGITSPVSPVFGVKKSTRPVIYESEDSFESTSSPWMSKKEGIINNITNGSTSKQKLQKFRRLRAISESDSDDSPTTPISSTSPVESVGSRSYIEKLNELKSMYPIRSTTQLEEALDYFHGDFNSIVNALMDGIFDTELISRKRKRSLQDSVSSPQEGEKSFKRIRMMQSSESIESVSANSSQSTVLDTESKDQRLSVLMEALPEHTEKKLLNALKEHNWSVEDAMLSLVNRRVENGNDSSKTKKKEKKKAMKSEEDLSDEDEDYFEDGWDSDSSMEEEEVMGQAKTILSFFEEATLEELYTVPGCSRKKAELILNLRPFENWDNMVQTFESTKSLSYNLISGCKETIHVRTIVTKLMKRCEKIAEEMESVVTSLTGSKVDESRITKQPSLLNESFELKPYQMIGLNWLRIMHTQELNGILADEMGLGKTIQAIAFLSHLLEQGDAGPHVIIVPSSTMDNWMREARNWCPSMKIIMYYGSIDERRLIRYRIFVQGKKDFHVLLTTYNIATGSVEDRSLFKKCEFHYAVFDEGHMLKNMSSLRFQNLMKIRADRRLLLTGTPLQNNLVELMSLLCFVMPDLFIGKTEPLRKIFAMMTKQSGDEQQGRYEKTRIAQAKRIMKPFVLRRLKVDVLKQLPIKLEEIRRCPMIPDQQELYESLIGKYSYEVETMEKPERGIAMFMQLRKASNHPLLVRNHFNDDKLQAMAKLIAKEPSHRDRGALPDLIQEDMAVLNDFDINCLCSQYKKYVGSYALNESVISESGKFRMLDEILEKGQSQGDRILLFSQFVMMLDIMEPYLKAKGIRYLRLDGSTPVPERQRLIDQYNNESDIFIFLLSTRAGGLGINLTAANVVVLHDIDFNPYNDKQAEDRCHRLGQKREVRVIRLISKDTCEEGIMRCAQDKLKLEKEVTTSEKGENEEDSTDVVSLLKEAFVQYKKKSSS